MISFPFDFFFLLVFDYNFQEKRDWLSFQPLTFLLRLARINNSLLSWRFLNLFDVSGGDFCFFAPRATQRSIVIIDRLSSSSLPRLIKLSNQPLMHINIYSIVRDKFVYILFWRPRGEKSAGECQSDS